MRKRPINKRACVAAHTGPWMIKRDVLESGLAQIKLGRFEEMKLDEPLFDPLEDIEAGVAVLNLDGPVFRLRSKFGGFSSNEATEVVRELAARDDVHTIFNIIDSPGGQVAGSFQLSDALFEARRKKRIVTHVRNLAASAGFLLAAQSDEITIDEAGLIGCMGVFMVLEDVSGLAEAEGIKPILVSTGGVKGEPVDGLPVREEVIAEFQGLVDTWGQLFVEHVARGRGISEEQSREWMTGQCFPSKLGIEMGMADGVSTVDKVMDNLRRGRPAMAAVDQVS